MGAQDFVRGRALRQEVPAMMNLRRYCPQQDEECNNDECRQDDEHGV